MLQTGLSPEEIVWKVKAIDSESFQNVQVIDMTEEPREAPTLTAEDLARALGMNWWEVTLPDDLPPNSRMGLVVKDADGAIIHKTPGFWTRSLPGRRFKVIVWDSSDGMSLNYAAMDSKTRFSGPSIPKTEAMQGAARSISERKREMGDLLMKYWTIGGSGGTEELRRGDIGLSLDIVGTEEAAPEE
jgi:hypothetical protein